jgi:hypothetical protein
LIAAQALGENEILEEKEGGKVSTEAQGGVP